MKKLLVLTSVVLLSLAGNLCVNAQDSAGVNRAGVNGAGVGVNGVNSGAPTQEVAKQNAKMKAEMQKRRQAFEEKLGLTEAQKEQAKEVRIKSFKKLKPLKDEIKAKKDEIEAVKKSRIAVQEQDLRITALEKEIAVLEKKVKKIYQANMKDFESILTKEQKAILKDMKKDAKAKHHARK